MHWPERLTNFFGRLDYNHDPEDDGIAIEETLSALQELVDQGKIVILAFLTKVPGASMSICVLRMQTAGSVLFLSKTLITCSIVPSMWAHRNFLTVKR